MPTKIYRAYDIREALSQIRQDMGPDAYIVHQRLLPASRWWPFGRRQWEIVASAPKDEREAPPPRLEGLAELAAEVADLKARLSRLARAADLTRLPEVSEPLTDGYAMLCQKGMAPELAQEIILAARDELSPLAQSQPDSVRAALRRQLEQRVHTRPVQPLRGSGPLVVFLLGQAGVGKTTTLVKLATRQFLEGRRVCLVNADMARAAASAQIEILGKALSVDVETVNGPEAFKNALARHDDKQVIFVDTPGYSHRDKEHIAVLAALAKEAPRRQVFLVISCTTSIDEMERIVQGFRVVGLDGLIFSKLDETEALGMALTLACRTDVPVAYLTTGRRIPEDIEPCTPERLSALLLNGSAPSPQETLPIAPKKASSKAMAEPQPPADEAAQGKGSNGNGSLPESPATGTDSPAGNGLAEKRVPGQSLRWRTGWKAYHANTRSVVLDKVVGGDPS
jgi:flagellar biosynthesis protein FlhF